MKKYISFLLAALMLMSLCTVTAAADAVPEADYSESPYIILVNARIDDDVVVKRNDSETYIARADLPDENTVIDHWEINGKPVDAGGRLYSLKFPGKDVGLVEAFLREKLNVFGINCYLQFPDKDGKPAGDMYSRIGFEYDYTVPTTGEEHARGTIDVIVTADIPEGMAVDYWLINGVAYCFEEDVTSFAVIGLDETTTYEVVLRDKNTAASTVAGLTKAYSTGKYKPGIGKVDPNDYPYQVIKGHFDLIDPIGFDGDILKKVPNGSNGNKVFEINTSGGNNNDKGNNKLNSYELSIMNSINNNDITSSGDTSGNNMDSPYPDGIPRR